jgi:hypothetical protein
MFEKYFVLEPKGNSQYAKASREALISYANSIEEFDSSLSDSLKSWVDNEEHQSQIQKINISHDDSDENKTEIEIEIDNETFNYIALTAHELDITFNECIQQVLEDYIGICENTEV